MCPLGKGMFLTVIGYLLIIRKNLNSPGGKSSVGLCSCPEEEEGKTGAVGFLSKLLPWWSCELFRDMTEGGGGGRSSLNLTLLFSFSCLSCSIFWALEAAEPWGWCCCGTDPGNLVPKGSVWYLDESSS